MSQLAPPPRFLPNVLQAISDLNELSGSNVFTIAKHVKTQLNDPDNPRTVSTQVQRALKYAVTSGILKQRAGKYRIMLASPRKSCEKCKRRKRMQNKRGRRPRRHANPKASGFRSFGHVLFDDDDDANANGNNNTGNSKDEKDKSKEERKGMPVVEVRRRRRRRRKSSRRRRTRKRAISAQKSSENSSVKGPDNDDKNKNDFINGDKRNVVYPDDHKSADEDNDEDNKKMDQEGCQCGVENCLCNVKEETDDNFGNDGDDN